MFFKVTAYERFLVKSIFQKMEENSFVKEVISNGFQKEVSKEKFNIFLAYKQELLNNKNTIKVTDFGAGSTIFSSDERQISKIAQVAGIKNKNAKLLMNLVEYFQPKNILEIGTSLGLATAALAIQNQKAKITTLEGCPETANIAQQQFHKFNLNNINLVVGNFSETLPKATANKQFDLIYFDGNHQKEATLSYFKTCLPTASENSIFIFDDIHWSKPMQEAWKEIQQHSKVTLTIDTFQWGIAFFKPQKTKQHYAVRI